MKVRGIRIGTRFVMEDRGGVWQKTAEAKAKCVFGNRETYGLEIDVDPEAFAFGIFGRWMPMEAGMGDGDAPAPAAPPAPYAPVSMGVTGSGISVEVVDCDSGAVVAEYKDAGPAEIAAMSAADLVGLTPRGGRKCGYAVMDMHFDVGERKMIMAVREDKPLGVCGSDAAVSDAVRDGLVV